MIAIPLFLRELMESEAFTNKQHPDYQITNTKVEHYMQILYPGEITQDATGRFVAPEYDMTLEQFEKAQEKLKEELEEKIKEVKNSEEDDDYEDPDKDNPEIEFRIFISETIPVKVLMNLDNNIIETRDLEICDIEILDPDEEEDLCPDCGWPIDVCICDKEEIYVWSDDGECDACSEMVGTILDDDHVPSLHPNCNCQAVKMTPEEYRDEFGEPSPAKQEKYQQLKAEEKAREAKEMDKDRNFETAYGKLKEPEGGYTDGKKQVKDEPTNMGIKQSTLDKYNEKTPDNGFPKDVKELKPEQAREIYKNEYWDNTKSPNIENDRIRNAVFDMNVMGGAGKPVQEALNSFTNAGLKVDGAIGNKTINAINKISNDQVNGFMDTLKSERMEALRVMRNWPTAKGGWTTRTMAY